MQYSTVHLLYNNADLLYKNRFSRALISQLTEETHINYDIRLSPCVKPDCSGKARFTFYSPGCILLAHEVRKVVLDSYKYSANLIGYIIN